MAQILPSTDYDPDKVKVFGPGVENGVNPKEETHFTVDIRYVPKILRLFQWLICFSNMI